MDYLLLTLEAARYSSNHVQFCSNGLFSCMLALKKHLGQVYHFKCGPLIPDISMGEFFFFFLYCCGCDTGASWLSWGLSKGAEYTGIAIQKGASKLREHITPDDTPTQVSPTVTKSLHVAKQATGGAVKVSQFLGKNICYH